ncbi:MAG: family 20 glycosylhydrolase [Proteobacteria bacterium]|nr:family 20 glycosylhydrolase [Pseudomonadota bacterium]
MAGRSTLPALLPAPSSVRPGRGAFSLPVAAAVVLVPAADDSDFATARALCSGIERACGVRLPVETHRRREGLRPHLLLERRGSTGDEYELAVGATGITARAGGPAGLRYAVETLLQLVDSRGRVPACEVRDAPDFPVRGIMLDVSRGKVPTAESLRQLVDLCVRLKLNTLMLYTEHTFRFHRHPKIGADDSPMDAETVRELDRYAAERHVELIPTLQSLGHMEHVLALPEYAHLAESELGWTISPQDPGTYELLGDLYDEYLPNFRSHHFNANCDEPWDLERGKSAQRALQLGPGGVYLEHLHRIQRQAAGHGKRTLIWGDVVHAHPGRIAELDRDLILLDWGYEAEFDYDRVKVFAENGIEFWVCPGTSSWNCLFPRVENSRVNIARWAEAGRRHGARGLVNTDWGDFGHYNLQGNSWYAYAWGAQQAWSGDVSEREFDTAFSRVLFGDRSGEVARLYRALGAIHDPGFQIFNGSALQYLFFDELERAYFVAAARPAALGRCERRLKKLRGRIAAAGERFGDDAQTWAELVYAADASLLAVRKAAAGLEYLAWRRNPGSLAAAARRRLARRLSALAAEQAELSRTLRRLWLARARVSNLATTRRRIAGSVKSLRRAASRLERNRPSAPPPPHPGFSESGVIRAVRASLA